MASQPQSDRTVFRRIRGRIVPVRLKQGAQREARAVQGLASAGIRTGALASIAGLVGVGLGGLFAAGRLERHSQAMFKRSAFHNTVMTAAGKPLMMVEGAKVARVGGLLNRAAKLTKFASKYGVGALIGTQVARMDRGTAADEGARFASAGAAGGRSDPLKLAVLAAGAYGYMRYGKRFEKWGLRGGKFPWKLKDI